MFKGLQEDADTIVSGTFARDPLVEQDARQKFAGEKKEAERLFQEYEDLRQCKELTNKELNQVVLKIERLEMTIPLLRRLVKIGDFYQFWAKHYPKIRNTIYLDKKLPTDRFFETRSGSQSEEDKDDTGLEPAPHENERVPLDSGRKQPRQYTNPNSTNKQDQNQRTSSRSSPQPQRPTAAETSPGETRKRPSNRADPNDSGLGASPSTPKTPKRECGDQGQDKTSSNKDQTPSSPEEARSGLDTRFQSTGTERQPGYYTPTKESTRRQPEPTKPNPRPFVHLGPTVPVRKIADLILNRENRDAEEVSQELYKAMEELKARDREEVENQQLKQLNPYETLQLPEGYNMPKLVEEFDRFKKPFRKYLKEQELDKFDGTSGGVPFRAWWREFRQNVHLLPENYAPQSEKLRALKELLDGKPKNLVEPYVHNQAPNAYAQALSALQSTYGTDTQTRTQLENEIKELKPSSRLPSAVQTFVNTVNAKCQELILAGEKPVTACTLAFKTVTRKIKNPYITDFMKEIHMFTGHSPDDFYELDPPKYWDQFIRCLTTRMVNTYRDEDEDESELEVDSSITLATRVEQVKQQKPPFSRQGGFRTQQKKDAVTPAAPKKPKEHKCVFCSESGHANDLCSWDIKKRILFAEQQKLCRSCLKVGHKVSQCPSKFTCFHCIGTDQWNTHNTALCPSPAALAARARGDKPDWKLWREKSRTSAEYQKLREQKMKSAMGKLPAEVRTALSQVLDIFQETSDNETEEVTEPTTPIEDTSSSKQEEAKETGTKQ
jgi:hypothetical protein